MFRINSDLITSEWTLLFRALNLNKPIELLLAYKWVVACSIIITFSVMFYFASRVQPTWLSYTIVKIGQVGKPSSDGEIFIPLSVGESIYKLNDEEYLKKAAAEINITPQELEFIKSKLQFVSLPEEAPIKNSFAISLYSHSSKASYDFAEKLSSYILKIHEDLMKPHVDFLKKKLQLLNESLKYAEDYSQKLSGSMKNASAGKDVLFYYANLQYTILELKDNIIKAEIELNSSNTFPTEVRRIIMDTQPRVPNKKMIAFLSIFIGLINGLLIVLGIEAYKKSKLN